MSCVIWELERYARLTSQITLTESGNDLWEHFDNSAEPLQLAVAVAQTDHLFIHHGKKQLESVSLSGASSWVKGVSKGDSLMVVCKIQNTNRRFRVKFSASSNVSGEKHCRDCVERLAQHFQVKIPTGNPGSGTASLSQQISGTQGTSTPPEVDILDGDVTIGQMAQAISSSKGPQLGEAYSRHIHDFDSVSEVDLNTAVKLCLTDPNFPAFVGQVEKEIEKLTKQSL